jgi:hypothetical protein
MIKKHLSQSSLFVMVYIELLKKTNLELTRKVMEEVKRITLKKIV